MLPLLVSLSVASPLSAETEATLVVGWLDYGDLWVGDPVLGGFDGRSSPFLLDRPVLSATAGVTAWAGEAHRLRLRLDTRTLQHATVLRPDGELGFVVTSDGAPIGAALRERAFVDEASWRLRPRRDRSVELRAGVLPFSIARGRFLAESWPGVSASIDGGALGGPPLAADLRGAVTTAGALEAALTVRRSWSAFDTVGIEVAAVRDPRGVVALLEEDPGLLLGVLGAANRPFLDDHGPEVAAWLSSTYLQDPYGLAAFQADATAYLDLDGTATLGYASLFGEGVVGGIRLDAAATLGVGSGVVSGDRIPDGAEWATPSTDWPTSAPKERWDRRWGVRALAFDVAADWLGGAVAPRVFVQGASGDPDLVSTAVSEAPLAAFLAPDQSFLRTRVFPVDAARRGGAVDLPPGVGSYGLVAIGAGASITVDALTVRPQLAVPWSWVPTCTGCEPAEREARRHQGVEGDVLGAWRIGPVTPTVEAGAFLPGRFFLDDSNPERDELRDLPVGWRLFVGIGIRLGR